MSGIADRPGMLTGSNTSMDGTVALTPNMMRNSVADRPEPSTLTAAPTTVWLARSVTVSSANSAPTSAPEIMAKISPTHTLPLMYEPYTAMIVAMSMVPSAPMLSRPARLMMSRPRPASRIGVARLRSVLIYPPRDSKNDIGYLLTLPAAWAAF